MTGYELSRSFFDWCFENTSKVTPNHIALYFFCIEHNNRLGWKKEFGLPMEMAKDAIGIKNYRTYSKTFNDLVDWGFIKVIQRSKNQYSANIIAIANNTKANAKALSKALSKAMQKHSQKQVHGIVGIDKPITKEPNNSLSGNPTTGKVFSNKEKIEMIINFLNQKTGKNFKANAKANISLIEARLKNGYEGKDFCKVISTKTAQWKGTEQEMFLRPETLFTPKHFESYLNEVSPVDTKTETLEERSKRLTLANIGR